MFYFSIFRFIDVSKLDKKEKNLILKKEFEFNKQNSKNEEKILNVIEQKVGVLLGGYVKKMNLIQKIIEDNYFEIDQKNIEQEVFKKMMEQVKN